MTGRLAAGLLILAAGCATTAVIVLGGRGDEPAARDLVPAAVAEVTKQDLADTTTATGIVGYGRERPLAAAAPGTVTALPAVGSTVRRGGVLLKVDQVPTVLLYGKVPAYRTLRSGVRGADVRQLEENLRELGYRGFTVDDVFGRETAQAVRKWQKDIGVKQTGMVELGRVVFQPDAIRVNDQSSGPGTLVHPGSPLLTVTGTEHLVTVRLDESEYQLAKIGAMATVKTPAGEQVQGKVATAQFVVNSDRGGTTTEVELTVAIGAIGYDRAAVDVTLVSEVRKGILTVPVAALLALSEGGYGVELADGRIVPVRTGLFAGGRVEVSGQGLSVGLKVGMPT
ncbi:peptidoglycan-binding domain-containing protein [Streptosporangium sp. NPDC051023]|uniref:peptidoglycan-binding domain-containing protein n=1 Tax=Streptosporangium sp. NPDC051023 TaxID=3155410 RepID=UPI00344BF99C